LDESIRFESETIFLISEQITVNIEGGLTDHVAKTSGAENLGGLL